MVSKKRGKNRTVPFDSPNTNTPIIIERKDEDYIFNEVGELVPRPGLGTYKRNPNGAGPYGTDPRQDVCWDLYMKSIQRGHPSAHAAALEAGYAPNTSLQITSMKWFKERKEKLSRRRMFSKAERNLSRVLDMEYSTIKLMEDGAEVEEINIDKLKIVTDVSKLIVQTLGKDEGYSTKVVEDKNVNQEITIKSISYADPLELEAQVVGEIINAAIEAPDK
ncbi:MAG: hypothetical protein UT21_C0011G0009 [Candidatus Woesebacteria bacterium GW2011_GWA1_39_11b]|nr:MAG: hypothetical protein UT21_C0011G0009 [Candidatus Woesebacteria bacterium GW2011_GWA1_39_11b]